LLIQVPLKKMNVETEKTRFVGKKKGLQVSQPYLEKFAPKGGSIAI